jgi:hypothetical protein
LQASRISLATNHTGEHSDDDEGEKESHGEPPSVS